MSYKYIGVGVYQVPQAARLTKLSPDRVTRWLRGYTFRVKEGARTSPAVVHPDFPVVEGALALSFLDLQEVMFVGAFLGAGVRWKHLRKVHAVAQERMGAHPFSTGLFVTDGYRIFQDLAPQRTGGALEEVVSNQMAFKKVIAPYLATLDFPRGPGRVERWWPLGKSRKVVVDPQRAFGQPIVSDEGVLTAVLARAYTAEKSYRAVAVWFDVSERSVRDAVFFETAMAA